jgi:hypothetical protein
LLVSAVCACAFVPKDPARSKTSASHPKFLRQLFDTIRSNSETASPRARSRERVVQTLHQLHAAIEKLFVRYSLPGPALEDFVDAITFFAAEFAVR